MKKGIKPALVEKPSEPNGVQFYKKRIRSNMILIVESSFVFLFFYEGRYYATIPEKDENVFQFQKNSEPPFIKTIEFANSRNFREALWEKYSAMLDNGGLMDAWEYLECFEGSEESFQSISKKQRLFLDVVLAIERGDFLNLT